MPGLLSWVVTVIRGSEYEASNVCPGPGSNIRQPLSVFPSLDRVLRDQFPGFIGTMKVLGSPTKKTYQQTYQWSILASSWFKCPQYGHGVCLPVVAFGPRRRQNAPFFAGGAGSEARALRSPSVVAPNQPEKTDGRRLGMLVRLGHARDRSGDAD